MQRRRRPWAVRGRVAPSIALAVLASTLVACGADSDASGGSDPITSSPARPSAAQTTDTGGESASPDPTSTSSASPAATPHATTPALVDTGWAAPDGSGCPAPRWPTTLSEGAPANGERVLVIGDSRTRESRKDLVAGLVASGWTPTVRCWGWKDIEWGIAQVRRARKLHQLPDWVVVALGINDMKEVGTAGLAARIDRMLDAIGPGHHVLWLEEFSDRSPSRYSDSHMEYPPVVAAFNRHLHAREGGGSGLTVIPWVSVVKAEGLRLFDGIHYDARGYRVRARTIVGGLNARITRA